jgi:hypothetical protein
MFNQTDDRLPSETSPVLQFPPHLLRQGWGLEPLRSFWFLNNSFLIFLKFISRGMRSSGSDCQGQIRIFKRPHGSFSTMWILELLSLSHNVALNPIQVFVSFGPLSLMLYVLPKPGLRINEI